MFHIHAVDWISWDLPSTQPASKTGLENNVAHPTSSHSILEDLSQDYKSRKIAHRAPCKTTIQSFAAVIIPNALALLSFMSVDAQSGPQWFDRMQRLSVSFQFGYYVQCLALISYLLGGSSDSSLGQNRQGTSGLETEQ
jgi:hypothetical protein